MVYMDENVFAIDNDYANWAAYAAARPNKPILANLTKKIRTASNTINKIIGTFNTDITDTRFLEEVQDLCLKMVNRMRQIQLGRGLPGKIPMFSPNDFLIDRERRDLKNIGIILEKRVIGMVGI